MLLLTLFFSGFLFQKSYTQEQKFKAIFVYNFTKYLNWPESSIGDEFIIAVLGNNPIIDELRIIANAKTVLNKKIVVNRISQDELNQKFQILFIPKENYSLIKSSCESLAGKPVLIISEKVNGCNDGAGINFIQKNNNLSFELNKLNITKRGISINSQLLSLATQVE